MSKIVDAVVGVVSDIFGGGQKSPQQAPAVAAPAAAPAPVANSQDVALAKQQSIAQILQRQGRASTILDNGNTGGTLGTNN